MIHDACSTNKLHPFSKKKKKRQNTTYKIWCRQCLKFLPLFMEERLFHSKTKLKEETIIYQMYLSFIIDSKHINTP